MIQTSNDESKKICLNTNCIMFVIDRQYLNITQSNVEIKKTPKFVKIRDFDNTLHDNSKYVYVNFYISKKLFDENETITLFKQKIYIVDNFRVNMLLKSNIFDFEKIVVDMKNKFVNFLFCERISAFINITIKKRRIIRTMRNTTQLTIFAHF